MAYNKVVIQYVQNPDDPTGPLIPTNVVANPQPGDQTIQDIYQNIFDNWNKSPGTYELAGVSTASDGTRTALQPASLNTGVIVARDVDNAAVSPQPLYENLNYVRYIVQYPSSSTGHPGKPTNIVDPSPFKQDAFDFVFMKVQYPSTSTGHPGLPTNVAGRVPQPYQSVKINYVVNPDDPTGPLIPSTVLSNVVLVGETVLLTLDISNDPDSPYLTLEDDVHSLSILVPVS